MDKSELIVCYGNDTKELSRTLCEAAQLRVLIGAGAKIGIKPNLVLASPAHNGATTHPELVAGVIEYLQHHGFFDISIIEGAWVGAKTQQAFHVCGYTSIAEKYGVKLIDTQQDTHTKCAAPNGFSIDICNSSRNVDFMINMPVLKGHCQTKLTCALKNNKGIITNGEKRRFHTMGLHKPIALLNTLVRNDFILVDGICGDLDFEEGGTPVERNMAYAALDPVLCDAYACSLMGLDVEEVDYIPLAHKLGVGEMDVSRANITYLNQPAAQKLHTSKKTERYARHIQERDACSACYASLVHALHKTRFAGKVCVGQGFKGLEGSVGIGNCTSKFEHTVPGCPPTGRAVLELLNKL